MSQLLTFTLGTISSLFAILVGAVVTFLLTTRTNEASFLRKRRFALWEQQVARIEEAINLVLSATQISSQIARDRNSLQELKKKQPRSSEPFLPVRYEVDPDTGRELAVVAGGSNRRRQEGFNWRLAEAEEKLESMIEELYRLAFIVIVDGSPEDLLLEATIDQINAVAAGKQTTPVDLTGFLEAMMELRDTLPVLRT